MSLNNRLWLERQFAVRRLTVSRSRLGIDAILNWTDPGPGGFYDDLGDPNRPHLLPGSDYDQDPAFLQGALTGFDQDPTWRRTWCRHAARV